jgi:hypothetical protein
MFIVPQCSLSDIFGFFLRKLVASDGVLCQCLRNLALDFFFYCLRFDIFFS